MPDISTAHTYMVAILTVFNINILGYYTVYRNRFFGYGLIIVITFALLFILLKELEVYYYYALTYYYKKDTLIFTPANSSVVSLTNKNIPGIHKDKIVGPKSTSNYTTIDVFSNQFWEEEIDHHKARLFLLNVILTIKFWHVYVVVMINLVYLYIVVSRPRQNTLEILGL